MQGDRGFRKKNCVLVVCVHCLGEEIGKERLRLTLHEEWDVKRLKIQYEAAAAFRYSCHGIKILNVERI